jgi:hypothetical protein
VAIRWSKNHRPEAPEPAAPSDPELSERLDDELRNLD